MCFDFSKKTRGALPALVNGMNYGFFYTKFDHRAFIFNAFHPFFGYFGIP